MSDGVKRVLYDDRWRGAHGIARFAEELYRRLSGLQPLGTRLKLFHPLDPLWTSHLASPRRVRAYLTPGFNPPWSCRVPLLLTVHDLNYINFPENSDAFRRAYFNHLVRPACRGAYRVLTVSNFSRGQIAEWARIDESRIVNVGAGVDEKFSPHGTKADRGAPYLLAFANERPHKNTTRVVQAFIRSGLANAVKLLIVGTVSQDTRAAIGAATESIDLVRYVPEAELPALYRGALGLCMPSLFEGFGLPVIEAMACGVPVITSARTSLPEIAGDAALFVDPTDIEDIAAAMKRVVEDSALRGTLIDRGIAQSRCFTWDRTAARVGRLLEGIS